MMSSLSLLYMLLAIPIWRMLLRHGVDLAFDFARPSAGKSKAAKMAMIAMATKSSTIVNAQFLLVAKDAFIGHERSEEHTSELQSRFGISYAVFCLKKNTN